MGELPKNSRVRLGCLGRFWTSYGLPRETFPRGATSLGGRCLPEPSLLPAYAGGGSAPPGAAGAAPPRPGPRRARRGRGGQEHQPGAQLPRIAPARARSEPHSAALRAAATTRNSLASRKQDIGNRIQSANAALAQLSLETLLAQANRSDQAKQETEADFIAAKLALETAEQALTGPRGILVVSQSQDWDYLSHWLKNGSEGRWILHRPKAHSRGT